jgi:Rod binding domain-containing protein
MHLNPISGAPASPLTAAFAGSQTGGDSLPIAPGIDKSKLADASQQFESILVRQFLNESMKPMLEAGPSGQVYGYFLTEKLADSLGKGGGFGLASVFQAQLGGK